MGETYTYGQKRGASPAEAAVDDDTIAGLKEALGADASMCDDEDCTDPTHGHDLKAKADPVTDEDGETLIERLGEHAKGDEPDAGAPDVEVDADVARVINFGGSLPRPADPDVAPHGIGKTGIIADPAPHNAA